MPRAQATRALLWYVVLLLTQAAAQQDAGLLISQALAAGRPSSGLVQVQLPVSSFVSDVANITVPTNTTLLLLGQGNSSTSLQWDVSSGTSLPRITVQTGAVLALANLTLLLSQPLPTAVSSSAMAVHWAQLFSLPGVSMQAGSMLQSMDVVVMMQNCTVLATYQDAVCVAAKTFVDKVISVPQAPNDNLFFAPRILPGCVRYSSLSGEFSTADGGTAMAQFSNLHMLCPSSANMSHVGLGMVDPGVQLPHLATQLGTTQCLILGVYTAQQLLGYLQTAPLLVKPQGLVVLQLQNNISVANVSWPEQGVPINSVVGIVGPQVQAAASSKPVSAIGVPMQLTHPPVELDLAGVCRSSLTRTSLPTYFTLEPRVTFTSPAIGVPAFVVLNRQQGLVLLENLYMVNLAIGSDDDFPDSLLVGALWAIQFNRRAANSTMLLLRNCRLIVPEDLYSYMEYWVGIQSSLVPPVSRSADWLQNIVYFGLKLGGADNHTLIFSRREGQGTLWINSSLTDLPYHTPVNTPSVGIRELSPNGSLVPLTLVKPIHNASDLISQLLNASAPANLMLLSSMQLTADAVAQAASAARLDQSTIPITRPTTVTGRPLASIRNQPGVTPKPVALDLGGASPLFSLSLPQGKLLTFQRLTLTGLAPYNASRSMALGLNTTDNAPTQPFLGDLTSALWAMEFPRRQQSLQILNVTLIVSPYELAAVSQALTLPGTAPQSQPLDETTATALSEAFGLANLESSTPDMLRFSDLAFSGITGSGVVLKASPNVSTWQLQASAGADTAPGGHAQLSTGGIVGVAIGSVVVLAMLLLLAWMSVRKIGALRRAVDEERAAKTAALHQVEALSQQGTPPASDNHHAASVGTHPSSSRAGSVAAQSFRTTHSMAQDSSGHHASAAPAASNSMHLAGSTDSGQSAGLYPQYGANRDSTDVNRMVRSLDSGRVAAGLPPRPSPPSTSTNPSTERSAVGSASTRTLPTVSEALASDKRSAGAAASSARHSTAVTTDTQGSEGHSAGAGAPQMIRGSHVLADVVPFEGTVSQGSQQGPSLALALDPNAAPLKDSCFDAGPSKGLVIVGNNSVVVAPPGTQPPQLEQAKQSSASTSGRGRAAADDSSGTGTSSSRPLLDQGLAAGDDSSEPALLLQQVIAQRKEMQGIDMQQITFLSVLGQGNFGVVYKGKWRSMTVAIKTLMFQDASEAKRIRQRAITEAAINSVLTHDNIVNTFAHDLRPVVGGNMPDEPHAACWKLYIIQEYCNGGSLAQAIDKRVFIESSTQMNNMLLILKVAEDIARGMAYIHENNVIHGDLSSGNVLLRYDPQATWQIQAKVGDFGLSRFLEGPGHSHISNVRQGTPFYIAPEVLNRGVMSKPADVFSFGVLLWEMFCGTPPWRDPALKAFQDTLNPLTYPYHVPRSCPVEYHKLVMACLAEDPKERPRFEELLQRISELLSLLKQAVDSHYQQQQPSASQVPLHPTHTPMKDKVQPLMVVGDADASPQLTETLERGI